MHRVCLYRVRSQNKPEPRTKNPCRAWTHVSAQENQELIDQVTGDAVIGTKQVDVRAYCIRPIDAPTYLDHSRGMINKQWETTDIHSGSRAKRLAEGGSREPGALWAGTVPWCEPRTAAGSELERFPGASRAQRQKHKRGSQTASNKE